MPRLHTLLAAAALPLLAACGKPPAAAGSDPQYARKVARGQAVYAAQCATCHGAALPGQSDWRSRKPDGRMPAPPHDESGHTWHHPDEILFGITKEGLVPGKYGPPGYVSDMPAFGSLLSANWSSPRSKSTSLALPSLYGTEMEDGTWAFLNSSSWRTS